MKATNMLVGYARVNTHEQNLALQLSSLKKIGCKKLYQDKLSGTKSLRPGFQMALEVLRKGDTLVVWKLDRRGRTIKGLIDLITEFERKKIHFRSITDNIDTSIPSGRFFFQVMESLLKWKEN